jgi:hypothetical protein
MKKSEISYSIKRDLTLSDALELLENARNEIAAYRLLATELAKELVQKCGSDVHKQQVADLEAIDPRWTTIPGEMCTAKITRCNRL